MKVFLSAHEVNANDEHGDSFFGRGAPGVLGTVRGTLLNGVPLAVRVPVKLEDDPVLPV